MTSTVHIAKVVYGGDGLGRLGDGRVVFVPGALAGETVKAEIVTEKKNFVKARLVEITDPSPDRTGTGEPPVPGMVYSNVSFKGELAAKEAQLVEMLERARIAIPAVRSDANASISPLNYRNKVVYQFALVGRSPARLVMGYRKEPGHELVDVESDPLARPEINAKLPEIRSRVFALLTNGAPSVRRSVEAEGRVTVRWSRLSGVQWWIGDAKNPVVMKETVCGKTFEVPSDGFWQVNPEVGEMLATHVASIVAKDPPREILDMYCGVGVLGLVSAAKLPRDGAQPPKIAGVESGRRAVDFARKNAASLGFPQATFIASEAVRCLRKIGVGPDAAIIVDPPRGGLEQGVAKFLASCGAKRIVYVSCDPATLARDLRTITAGYDVEGIRWFDMFPRTARFETVVELKKRK